MSGQRTGWWTTPRAWWPPKAMRGHEMDRVRRILDKDFTIPKRILELNRRHPLIQNLSRLVAASQADPVVNDCIAQLFESSLLLEGLHQTRPIW